MKKTLEKLLKYETGYSVLEHFWERENHYKLVGNEPLVPDYSTLNMHHLIDFFGKTFANLVHITNFYNLFKEGDIIIFAKRLFYIEALKLSVHIVCNFLHKIDDSASGYGKSNVYKINYD